MSAELDVLQDAIGRLEGAGIAYMLTGSVALSYYAEPRMTRDVDLVVELGKRDPKAVAALFAPDYYVSEEDIGRAIEGRTMFNVLHLEKLVKLDLIVRKDTAYRRREFECRRRVQMPGFEAWIASSEDLVLSGLAWPTEASNDTTPEFRRRMRQRLEDVGPVERTRMCTDMFETARQIVEASLPDCLDPDERRYQICRRFYGDLADRAFGRR
ncbi:MAG TPA: hypothetical protein VJ789_15855 [Burkholderiales bacterium]|nr:hypothetical protein [Burkholderiales bacterium]